MRIRSSCCGCATSTHLDARSGSMDSSASYSLANPTDQNCCRYLRQLGSRQLVSSQDSEWLLLDRLESIEEGRTHFVVFSSIRLANESSHGSLGITHWSSLRSAYA